MNEKVTQMVDLLFRDVQSSEEVQALHDEVLNNCQDRFADLTGSGLGEAEALAAVMESLKGMEDVLKDYPRKEAEEAGEVPEKTAEETDSGKDPGTGRVPDLMHFEPEDIRAIDGSLTFGDVEVEASEDTFSMQIDGGIFSELKPDGTLRLWQEKPSENLFRGIEWEKSFDSFESFGDALGRLGQNFSRIVNRGLSLTRHPDARVILRLPRRIHPDIRIRTMSGTIEWKDAVPGPEFTLCSTSGEISVRTDESFVLPLAQISTTSGDITLRMNAEKIIANSVSGDLSLTGNARELKMNSTSGDVDAAGAVREVWMKSTSGDLSLELTDPGPAEIGMNTVSGSVNVRLPDSVREAAAELNSQTGRIRTRGVDLVDDSPIHVKARTVSGDLSIS
ncbi:MAG: DUF4097 domain-containing protein [Clostridiales bacterium]|nr:DUF4097 domain-containing protein [Clostridiales bacterium]